MNNLLTLFNKERHLLEMEIDKATNLEQVVKLIHERIDAIERAYIGELNISQVRLASFFLETLRQSIAALAAANTIQAQTKATVTEKRKNFSSLSITRLIQALICTLIIGELFSLTEQAPGAWMLILLTAVLVGLEVSPQVNKSDREKNENSTQLEELTQPAIRVNSKVLLDNLADALNTIEQAVTRAKETNKSLNSKGMEDVPELLNIIQRLIGASFLARPQMALELANLLPQVLMEQGIRAQIYRPGDADSQREYFDFEPSIDRSSQEYVTITPALLKGDRLLLKGRVIEPAYSEARE
ncbi:MAG: hypothetical protein N3E45_13470 [Oscillatoriaceae bacterium SKW80]|nr:hypothetical protein [Oscillatoriaceae bacterium SKYG93]MCX8121809.1 hypothetical protein [Oscillatoriaceae bacterium SKW80]MDW8454569.1 hypothetical protein [Oscillatoriaceae cyanobacterium SKYGB_i_bin93]HIK27383.1 hypothetical protein [Oscillatoriaceae cyanobacterium M7585_C2015_266]